MGGQLGGWSLAVAPLGFRTGDRRRRALADLAVVRTSKVASSAIDEFVNRVRLPAQADSSVAAVLGLAVPAPSILVLLQCALRLRHASGPHHHCVGAEVPVFRFLPARRLVRSSLPKLSLLSDMCRSLSPHVVLEVHNRAPHRRSRPRAAAPKWSRSCLERVRLDRPFHSGQGVGWFPAVISRPYAASS